jgi:hypothetical protein
MLLSSARLPELLSEKDPWIIIDSRLKTKAPGFHLATSSAGLEKYPVLVFHSPSKFFSLGLRLSMYRVLALAVLSIPLTGFGQITEENPLKFAIYSPSWASSSSVNLLSGLRLVVDNQTGFPVLLESFEFLSDVESTAAAILNVSMQIAPGGLGEQEIPYVDLLSLNQCVNRALQENWRLVEISNYTLNPSVRRLIIEDTSAFRIYQCISTVKTNWTNTETGTSNSQEEWVLYHFESKLE